MSDTTPGPWDWMAVGANASGGHHLYVIDSTRRKIAALWGKAEEKKANAELIVTAPEMKTMIRDQHNAIDYLLARLIELDKEFMPTKCSVWPVVVQGKALLDKIGG